MRHPQIDHERLKAGIRSVLNGQKSWLRVPPEPRESQRSGANPGPVALICGSFNPLHEGHRQMGSFCRQYLGGEVAFELSIVNPDKPAVSLEEILVRTTQDFGSFGLILTKASTFLAKSALFPSTTFAVGLDTILRIADDSYYQSQGITAETAFELLKLRQCRFLVFGREINGEFRDLEQADLPPALGNLCDGVREESFRIDLSSSKLRRMDPDTGSSAR